MDSLTRENYREYDAINASLLKDLASHPSKLQEPDEEKEFNDGMALGDMIDILCFEPERFNEEYYINTADRDPSKTAKMLADWIFEGYKDRLEIVNDDVVAYTDFDWDGEAPQLSLQTLLSNAEDSLGKSTNFEKYGGPQYLKSLIQAKNKHVVGEELANKAKKATQVLKNHSFTRKYFVEEATPDHVDLHFQVPIEWELKPYTGVEDTAKSLLDIVMVNHNQETIYPIDLKSTGSYHYRFPREIVRLKYYIQASYYYYAVQSVTGIDLPDYDIAPFQFVVSSEKDITNPRLFYMNKKDIIKAKEGGVLSYSDREVRGWVQLIKDLYWHRENDVWSYSREVYENNGVEQVEVFQ